MTEGRISWDELWMETARLVGKRSLCSRAQYGAVIVSEDNRVLSVGYNGAPAGYAQSSTCDNWCERAITAKERGEEFVNPDYLDCFAVHAEQNAIMRAPNLWLEKRPTLYVNGVTCIRCALVIANSGIKEVVMYVSAYELKRNPEKTRDFLKSFDIEVRMKTWDLKTPDSNL